MRLVGANADLVQLVAKEVGLPIEVRYVGTWARVQEEARLGRVDLIAGAFLTTPRLEYMDYVHPAFHVARSLVWSREPSDLKYQRWADLQGKSGLTVIHNSFGEEFDRYAKASLKIATVPSLEQALRMLERSRADYLVYEEAPAQAYIARLGIQGLAPESVAVSNEGLYLTLSHKSPCNTPELRGRLAKAMYLLQKQNAMKKLIETHVQGWRTAK
jgi:polar amino acid transport system substrate-binding protein